MKKKLAGDSGAADAEAQLVEVDSRFGAPWPCRWQLALRESWGDAWVVDGDHPLENILRTAIGFSLFGVIIAWFLFSLAEAASPSAQVWPGVVLFFVTWITASFFDAYWVYDRLAEELRQVVALGPLRLSLRRLPRAALSAVGLRTTQGTIRSQDSRRAFDTFHLDEVLLYRRDRPAISMFPRRIRGLQPQSPRDVQAIHEQLGLEVRAPLERGVGHVWVHPVTGGTFLQAGGALTIVAGWLLIWFSVFP